MRHLRQRLSTRRSIRLSGYDYASAGAYNVTVCVHARQLYLGEVSDGGSRLWLEGQMVREVWDGLSERFPRVTADALAVMPNHVHGIVMLKAETNARGRIGWWAGEWTR